MDAAAREAMAGRVLVGTRDGLLELAPRERSHLAACEVTALVTDAGRWWAVVDGHELACRDGEGPWEELATVPDPPATCLAATPGGVLVGTAGAHLYRWRSGTLARVDGFETVAGRESWYTPWGDPPATRSLAAGPDGALYVNVHVGGVARSRDGGRSWQPTLDIETDVHQVLVAPERPGHVFVASASGPGWSADGGASWSFVTDGLHDRYCRAVALAGDVLLVSASTGPHGDRAALYRRWLDARGGFERCRAGLPEWLGGNVDTHCLTARGPAAVLGTEEGRVYGSSDGGRTFALLAKGLAPVQCVTFA